MRKPKANLQFEELESRTVLSAAALPAPAFAAALIAQHHHQAQAPPSYGAAPPPRIYSRMRPPPGVPRLAQWNRGSVRPAGGVRVPHQLRLARPIRSVHVVPCRETNTISTLSHERQRTTVPSPGR